jgi:hypothetical protein
MRVCKKFKTVTICSAIISVVCFFCGVVISYLYATPTGASVVLVNIAAFLLFAALRLLPQARLRARQTQGSSPAPSSPPSPSPPGSNPGEQPGQYNGRKVS